jgi:streptogramin lyase
LQKQRVIDFAVVLAASACEQAPTATVEGTTPRLATSAGHFRSFRTPSDNSQPRHITLGSDGNMWFTESRLDVGKIGRVDLKGKITEFSVPDPSTQPATSSPDLMAHFGLRDLRAFPASTSARVTTDGQFTGFAPACDDQVGCSIVADGIASGPDGNVWFTERIRNAVVKLPPSGVFTFYPIPTPTSLQRSRSLAALGRSAESPSTRNPTHNIIR